MKAFALLLVLPFLLSVGCIGSGSKPPKSEDVSTCTGTGCDGTSGEVTSGDTTGSDVATDDTTADVPSTPDTGVADSAIDVNRADVSVQDTPEEEVSVQDVPEDVPGPKDVSEDTPGGVDVIEDTGPSPCQNSLDCPGDLICDSKAGICVDCIGDPDCAPGQTCANNLVPGERNARPVVGCEGAGRS